MISCTANALLNRARPENQPGGLRRFTASARTNCYAVFWGSSILLLKPTDRNLLLFQLPVNSKAMLPKDDQGPLRLR